MNSDRHPPAAGLAWLYGATLFLGAALSFLVQPLFAKLALPSLGGAPAVWTTAMLFFQAALLAGYAYAHGTTRWLGPAAQARLHLIVLALPALTLPIAFDGASVPRADDPRAWLLGALAVGIGLPFFAVATTSPLVQAWFAASGHRRASDPYFLYALSNVGSLVGLLAYPLVLELFLPVDTQAQLWTYLYAAYAALAAACALRVRARAPATHSAPASPRPSAAVVAGWIARAFVPSSLMLGVTGHATTDIGSAPLLWAIPLALYLISLAIAFAPVARTPASWAIRGEPWAIALVAALLLSHLHEPALIALGLHLLGFFWIATAQHGALADRRPDASRLTGYYLAMATGGALGGAFNAIAAPLLFDRVAEYPLALALAALLHPYGRGASTGRSRPLVDALALVAPLGAMVACAALGRGFALDETTRFGRSLAVGVAPVGIAVTWLWTARPLRFALGLTALLVFGLELHDGVRGRLIERVRTFFGVHRVVELAAPDRPIWRQLLHGTTEHGLQSTAPEEHRRAMAYFHRTGPLGEVFATCPAPRAMGVVGLGIGTMATYLERGQRLVTYEIDPEVARIANDPARFTFLADAIARGVQVEGVLGDARTSLAREAGRSFDLLALDAFTSDAIPLHLMTREALALYRSHLAPGGLMLFQVTNRNLDLAPVLADLAGDAALACRVRDDRAISPADAREGKYASTFVAIGEPTGAYMVALARLDAWRSLSPRPGRAVWTDQRSSLIEALALGFARD